MLFRVRKREEDASVANDLRVVITPDGFFTRIFQAAMNAFSAR